MIHHRESSLEDTDLHAGTDNVSTLSFSNINLIIPSTAPWSKNLGKLNCPLQRPVAQWKVTLGELKSVFGQISLHRNLIFSKKLTKWVMGCPVESDPWGTQICVQSNLTTPNFDFFKKMEKWGMGLGMF